MGEPFETADSRLQRLSLPGKRLRWLGAGAQEVGHGHAPGQEPFEALASPSSLLGACRWPSMPRMHFEAHLCVYVYVHVCVFIHTYKCTRICACVYVYVYVYVHVYVYVYMYMYMYVCMYVGKYVRTYVCM